MSETVLFGKRKDPELMVFNFRGQQQCRMRSKREDPIEAYPKIWYLNSVAGEQERSLENPGVEREF